jgi:hypothetical protein
LSWPTRLCKRQFNRLLVGVMVGLGVVEFRNSFESHSPSRRASRDAASGKTAQPLALEKPAGLSLYL